MVRSIFFSHRVLQQWKSADVREISPVWHQGLVLQARRGAMVTAEQPLGSKLPKPLMAVVFLERKGSKEKGFSLCPVLEVCVLSKIPEISVSCMF